MYKSKFTTESIDRLYEAVLSLKTVEECHKFFEDLCTIKEIQDMSMRLDVAKLLKKKESYNVISEKTGASTATISRVSKSLVYGAGGYDVVLKR